MFCNLYYNTDDIQSFKEPYINTYIWSQNTWLKHDIIIGNIMIQI